MDWLFDAKSGAGRDNARDLVVSQVRRRAAEPSEAERAARLVQEAFDNLTPGESTFWVNLDWQGAHPILNIRPTTSPVAGPEDPSRLAEGVWAADENAGSLAIQFPETAVAISLPSSRAIELDVDLGPVQLDSERAGTSYTGTVASTIVEQVEMGASALEAAAIAGASCAARALSAYRDTHGGVGPTTALEVAEAVVAFQKRAGGDFFVVEGGDRRAVLANRTCPFGPDVAEHRTMCRTTSALIGSLAARANGKAVVTLHEAIAAGDSRCRATIDFDGEPSKWSHTYAWPPATSGLGGRSAGTAGFRVGLSLQLPRDRRSVPLIRHLVSHALQEVAVVEDDVADVALAVTEVAANVIEHSGSGDAYEVSLTIGPVLAELRVVDIGRGFDHEALADTTSGLLDERGRGLTLMKALVDQVQFISAPERGTVVHLVKRLHFDDSVPARQLMLAALKDEEGAAQS